MVKFKFDPWRCSKLVLRLSFLSRPLKVRERSCLPTTVSCLWSLIGQTNFLPIYPFLSSSKYDNPCDLTALPSVILLLLLRRFLDPYSLDTRFCFPHLFLSLLIQDPATYTLPFSWNQTLCYSKPDQHLIGFISYIIIFIVTLDLFQ